MNKQTDVRYRLGWCSALILNVCSATAFGELVSLNDQAMAKAAGQGITLSLEARINPDGGPLWSQSSGGSCTDNGGRCGLRVAIQGDEGSGWLILDDVSGGISVGRFADKSAPVNLNVEEVTFPDGERRDVIKTAYEGKLKYDNLRFVLASSTQAAPGQTSTGETLQRELFSLNFNGSSAVTGQLTLFPVE